MQREPIGSLGADKKEYCHGAEEIGSNIQSDHPEAMMIGWLVGRDTQQRYSPLKQMLFPAWLVWLEMVLVYCLLPVQSRCHDRTDDYDNLSTIHLKFLYTVRSSKTGRQTHKNKLVAQAFDHLDVSVGAEKLIMRNCPE